MSQTNYVELTPHHSGAANVKTPMVTTASAAPSTTTVEQTGAWRPDTPDSLRRSLFADHDDWRQQPAEDSPLEQPLPLFEAVRRFPKMTMYCLGITLSVIGWGYDLAIVGAIPGVDPFLADYGSENEEKPGELIIPAYWLSLWLALPPLASALGAVVAGWFGNRAGRRACLMLGCAVSAVAVTGIFSSHRLGTPHARRALFTAAISVQGFSVGIIKTACITYVSENAPTALRGPAMALFPAFNLVGQLIGLAVMFVLNKKKTENPRGYTAAFASQWGFSLLTFALAWITPESPAYLVRRGAVRGAFLDGRAEKRALASCARLFAPGVDPRTALRSIRDTVEKEESQAAASSRDGAFAMYAACFRGPDLRRTLIVALASTAPTIIGLDLLSNASIFLKSVGMDSSTSLLFMIIGIVAGMAANLTGIWMVSRVGRRRLILVSLAFVALCWGVMGVVGIWGPRSVKPPGDGGQGKPANEVAARLAWAAAGCMMAAIVAAGLGCWPASYAVAGETSSLQLRAPTQGIGGVVTQAASTAMAVALPLLFNPDAAALGLKTGFVPFGVAAVGLVLFWFFLPEMKDRTAAELDAMFKLRLPTRDFGRWKAPDEGRGE